MAGKRKNGRKTATTSRRKSSSNGRKNTGRKTSRRRKGGGQGRGDTRRNGGNTAVAENGQSSANGGGFPSGTVQTLEDGTKIGHVPATVAKYGNALLKYGKHPEGDEQFPQDGSAYIVNSDVAKKVFHGDYANSQGHSTYKTLVQYGMFEVLRKPTRNREESGRAVVRVTVDRFEPTSQRAGRAAGSTRRRRRNGSGGKRAGAGRKPGASARGDNLRGRGIEATFLDDAAAMGWVQRNHPNAYRLFPPKVRKKFETWQAAFQGDE